MKLPFRRQGKRSAARQPQLMNGQEDYAFRRSRTLTGTISSEVRAAAADRGQLKTPRLRLHELHIRRRTLVMRLTVVVILALVCGYLLHEYIGLNSTVIAKAPTTKPLDTSSYARTIHAYFADHPLEQFTFSLNDKQLSDYVAAHYPEVLAVVLKTDDAHGMYYQISLRRPLVVWQTSKQWFYIDASGTSFAVNDYPEPSLQVIDKSGIQLDNSPVASGRFIHFLGQLVGAINGRGIGAVTQVTLPPNTTRELDIRLAGKNYDIKTSVDRDPLQVAEDVAKSITALQRRGITPKYLDNRVAGKAFYQ